MKLLIKKSSKKGRLGTLSFLLYVRLETTPDEVSLLDRCNLLNDTVAEHVKEQGGGSLTNTLFALSENTSLKVHGLIEGHTLSCTRLEELIALENQLKVSGANLQRYLEIAESFGSEEVIDLAALIEKESC